MDPKTGSALLRGAVPPWVVRLAHGIDELIDPFCIHSYSQEGEDMVLRRLLERERCGFYIDVGAHHPYRFSNTLRFYAKGWNGINIDPDGDSISMFRRHRPRDISVQAGVSNSGAVLTYHRFRDSALNTFDPDLARERAARLGQAIVSTVGIETVSLAQLLDKHLPKGQAISFLSVDAEGLDLEVLRSNDWVRHRPRIVLAEASGVALDALATHPQFVYMSSVDYSAIAKTMNTVFYIDRSHSSGIISSTPATEP